MGVPMAMLTTFPANNIILIVYGVAYALATIALQILIWAMALIFVNSSFAYLFSSTNQQIVVAKVMGTIALLNVILNLLLIPDYTYIRASIATLLSDILTLVVMISISSKTKFRIRKPLLKDSIRILSASILMIIIITLLRDFSIILIVLVSVLFYLILLLVLKVIDKEDIAMLKSLIYL